MIEIFRNHPWVGVMLCAGAVGYWIWLFSDRHRKKKEIPAGEWIVFGIGCVALAFFLFLALNPNK